MPNLYRVGLLSDVVQPRYQELGLRRFASLDIDADIGWARFEAPLRPVLAAAAAK